MLPSVELPSSLAGPVNLAMVTDPSLIVCFYPGVRGLPSGPGSIELDTARARAWCAHHLELAALDYRVVGVSAQSVEDQRAWATRERLDCTLLSDVELKLAHALDLPTLQIAQARVYERLTLISHGREVTQVLYPVNPLRDAAIVMDLLRRVHAQA